MLCVDHDRSGEKRHRAPFSYLHISKYCHRYNVMPKYIAVAYLQWVINIWKRSIVWVWKLRVTEAGFIVSPVHAVIRKYSKFMLWSQALSLLQMRSKIMPQVFHDLIINFNICILWSTHMVSAYSTSQTNLPSWRQALPGTKRRRQALPASAAWRHSSHPSVWYAIYTGRHELKAPPTDAGV